MVLRIAFFFLLLLVWPAAAQAQYFQCPAGSVQVNGGGGIMCQCPDGSYAGMEGCRSAAPRYQPPPQQTEFPVNCGTYSCRAGSYCGSQNSCLTNGSNDCGNGRSCAGDTKCSRSGQSCLSRSMVDCGSFYCNAGASCGSGNKCLEQNVVDCGQGKSCPAGTQCFQGGAECLTPQVISERATAAQLEANRQQQIQQESARLQREQAACLSTAPKINGVVFALMCDPRESVDSRIIAAYALGLDPDRIGLSSAPVQRNAGGFSAEQLNYLRANVATLRPPSGPPNPKMSGASGSTIYSGLKGSGLTGFRAPPVNSTQSTGLLNRVQRAVDFANSSVSDDPNFQAGSQDLKTTAVVESAGCAAGALVGAVAGGVGAVPGCVTGAVVAGGALTAFQTGESIGAGITDIYRHKSDITITNAAKAGAEYYADKASDLLPASAMKEVGLPVSSSLKVGASWSTYFLYAFYTKVPGR